MADGAIGGARADNDILIGGRKRSKKRRLLLVALVCAVIGFALGYAMSHAQEEATVCPAGTAKWEADGGCEYGCDKATATFAGAQVDWQRLAPGVITGVCVKSATNLYAPATGPDGGSFTTPDGKDVSHIVITLAGPNSVGITGEIAATRGPMADDSVGALAWFLLAFGGAALGALGLLRLRKTVK